MTTTKPSILEEANQIITGPRRDAYGSVEESFVRVAQTWSAVLKTPITPSQVALCMLMLKCCRESNKPQRDNRVDIAGYVALLDLLESPDECKLQTPNP